MCQMCNPSEIRNFILAGNATCTMKSQVTGSHYTFKIWRFEKEGYNDLPKMWFVSLLTAPEEYSYLGAIDEKDGKLSFRLTKKSSMKEDSTPIRAMNFFLAFLNRGELAPRLDFYHESHCGRCGRPLTTPESIERGIGPECASKMGLV